MTNFLKEHNIFKFAAKELSQDAFICWVLDGLNYPNSEINRFSRAFMDLVLRNTLNQIHKIYQFDSSDVLNIQIERQLNNIDILATLEIQNGYGKTQETLIIEDKTFSTQHDNQLFRYRQIHKDKNPICIYYKTGYIFNDRIVSNENGYAVIDVNDMADLMKRFKQAITSDIFRSYFEYICYLKKQYDDIEMELINNMDSALSSHIGQFITMEKLLSPAYDMVVRKADFDNDIPPIIIDRIEQGQNIGGSPWTQYTVLFQEDSVFVRNSLVPDSESLIDNIFFRIDMNSKGYYLSLRQYNANESDMEKRSKRLPLLRELFFQAVEKIENERANRIPAPHLRHLFSKDDRGRLESKIADIYFKDLSKEDFTCLCELLPLITEAFVISIKAKVI